MRDEFVDFIRDNLSTELVGSVYIRFKGWPQQYRDQKCTHLICSSLMNGIKDMHVNDDVSRV